MLWTQLQRVRPQVLVLDPLTLVSSWTSLYIKSWLSLA